jgi:hypothetical protein
MSKEKLQYHHEESFTVRIIHILVLQKAITSKEASSIIKSFSNSDAYEFDAFLLEENLVSKSQLLKALETLYEVPSFDVVGYFFETNMLHKFPKHVLLQHGFIPLEDDENILVIVTSDPSNANLLPEIGKYVSYDIQFKVGIYQDIIDAIKEFYDPALTEGVSQDLYDLPDTRMDNSSEFDEEDGYNIEKYNQQNDPE